MNDLRDPREQLNGIRGWLLVFEIVLCLNVCWCALDVVLTLVSGIRNGYFAVYLIASVPYLATLVLLILCLVFLNRRNPRFRIFFAVQTGLGVLSTVFLAVSEGRLTGDMLQLGSYGWTAYLFLSDRVRITCGLPPKRSNTLWCIEQYEKARAEAAEAERAAAQSDRAGRARRRIPGVRSRPRRFLSGPADRTARPRAAQQTR